MAITLFDSNGRFIGTCTATVGQCSAALHFLDRQFQVLDRTAAIDQHADLSVELGALCRELGRELSRDDFARRDSPTVQPLQRLDLARLEAREVSCDLFLHTVAGIYPLRAGLPPI